ncbi:hypothetical protein EV356DRAFT_45811 [Viridothelium virens]|uniref:Uncharacterized protein n=1 Tax=Viridothelium virens TaxID=1048519 RepID=A0A6A6GSP4_VIRVR|nr:hypothetical protein EV356DRAFT_45811 [Viridothelium virens]
MLDRSFTLASSVRYLLSGIASLFDIMSITLLIVSLPAKWLTGWRSRHTVARNAALRRPAENCILDVQLIPRKRLEFNRHTSSQCFASKKSRRASRALQRT